MVSQGGEAKEGLALADTENLGAAGGASTLGGRPLILQRDRFGAFHFNLFPAFHAISLHHAPPILSLPSRVTNLNVFVNSCRHKMVTIFINLRWKEEIWIF